MVTSASDVDMSWQHDLVVHLVDVVAREDDDVVDAIAVDDVDVLVHGVGRARYQCVSSIRWEAGRMSRYSFRSARKKFQPRWQWRMRECALYWVATAIFRMPELSAFDSAKSMMRVLPPK